MRLTEEQIRQGLRHDDIEVRQLCLDYFTGMWSDDETVMPIVTQVIDALARDAFIDTYDIDQLAQTDATIEWVVRSLRNSPESFNARNSDDDDLYADDFDDDDLDDEDSDDEDTDDEDDRDFRHFLLLNARGDLVRRHRGDVLSVLSAQDQELVIHRLSLLSESPADLWKSLEGICEEFSTLEDDADFPEDDADDLVVTLAESGSVPTDRMMELLATEVPDEDDSALSWLEPQLVKLAGLIHHAPALPILLDKLRNKYVSEEAHEAIIRLGTDEVVRKIEERFSNEDWDWQFHAANALKAIHSEESVRAGTALLNDEFIEDDVKQSIAEGLASQFSADGLQSVGMYLDSNSDWLGDFEWKDILQKMQAAAKLMGCDLPRMKDWQTRLNDSLTFTLDRLLPDKRHWNDRGFGHHIEDEDFEDGDEFERPQTTEPLIQQTVIHSEPRVGRNDPCPCGSGKKFKKCCHGKPDAD